MKSFVSFSCVLQDLYYFYLIKHLEGILLKIIIGSFHLKISIYSGQIAGKTNIFSGFMTTLQEGHIPSNKYGDKGNGIIVIQ